MLLQIHLDPSSPASHITQEPSRLWGIKAAAFPHSMSLTFGSRRSTASVCVWQLCSPQNMAESSLSGSGERSTEPSMRYHTTVNANPWDETQAEQANGSQPLSLATGIQRHPAILDSPP